MMYIVYKMHDCECKAATLGTGESTICGDIPEALQQYLWLSVDFT